MINQAVVTMCLIGMLQTQKIVATTESSGEEDRVSKCVRRLTHKDQKELDVCLTSKVIVAWRDPRNTTGIIEWPGLKRTIMIK